MANPLSRTLASLFRSRADVTSLKSLEREGIRTVNVLDVERLEDIVIEAVERVLAEFSASPAAPDQVAAGAQIELLKILGSRARLNQRDLDLERERHDLEGNLGSLRGALVESKKKLEASLEIAEREAIQELREELDHHLNETFQRARADVERVDPRVAAAVVALQAPLRGAMLSLLEKALRRRRPGAPSESQTQVDLLERRVRKLTAQLEETQQLLERVRDEKTAGDEGVASVYRTVQGLKGNEKSVEQRRALMREIFRHNLELRNSTANPAGEPPRP